MTFFPSRNIFVTIGNVSIYWYGIIIMFAAILVYFLLARRIKKAGYEDGVTEDLFIGCLIWGVIGAR